MYVMHIYVYNMYICIHIYVYVYTHIHIYLDIIALYISATLRLHNAIMLHAHRITDYHCF